MRLSRKSMILTVFALLFAVLVVAACAPRESPPEGAVDDVPIVQATWGIESDCQMCHEAEVASGTNPACAYSVHVPEGVSCTTCHTDDNGRLQQAHSNYTTAADPVRLKQTKVAQSSCLTPECHDTAELQAVTASSVVLTDSKGKTVNPHELPEKGTHATDLSCASCHKMHSADDLAVTAAMTCV
ncbi:MAG: cytochrome c3 family protein, partial [Coriobacteriales bacterium]|nr:cytochrome c3 family protein [Coriobacteriales bacterium]